jgi:hypothetical protein
MDRIGILGLGISSAGFAALTFYGLFGSKAWPTVLCFGAMYLTIALLLFFNCRCGKERQPPPPGGG